MFGNVTALVGLHVTGIYRDEKHAAHMLQAGGLGFSQVMSRVGINQPLVGMSEVESLTTANGTNLMVMD